MSLQGPRRVLAGSVLLLETDQEVGHNRFTSTEADGSAEAELCNLVGQMEGL